MRASPPKLGASRHSPVVLALVSCACVLACSLIAPSDDHFVRDAQLPRPQGGETSGGEGGQGGKLAGAAGELTAGEAGASGDGVSMAGAGGAANEGGAAGVGGGDASSGCGPDLLKEAGVCVSISGCSDGTREAFLTVSDWPKLAGCTAKWPRASLRDAKTGRPCGFELGVCAVPADACGEGWHVCASPPYGPTEISDQATAEECAAQHGAYVAAVGDQFCEPCSDVGDGAACCGDRCIQQNGSCIFPGQTAWFGVYDGYKNVCGAIESDLVQRGVLCCRD